MKKLIGILLTMCMLAVVFTACGGNDTTSEPANKEVEEAVTIVGTWEYSALNCAYTFNADGSGSYSFGGSELPFTYTDDGSKVTIQYENSDAPGEYTYTIEGNTLHITDDFGNVVDYTKK